MTRSLGLPNFATCSMVMKIYKIRSDYMGFEGSPSKDFGGEKHQNFVAISDNLAT